MNCKEMTTANVCFRNDAVDPPEYTTLVAHYEYAENDAGGTIVHAVRYTTPDGVPVDTSTGEVTGGECGIRQVQDLCGFPPPEGVLPAGQWVNAGTNLRTATLSGYGEPVNVEAAFANVNGSVGGGMTSNANGNLILVVNPSANPNRQTTPSGQIVFTADAEMPVVIGGNLLFGSTTAGNGLFGTTSLYGVSFSERPIYVPAGVVEIAPDVWGNPNGGTVPGAEFRFPPGSLNAGRPFIMDIYRSLATQGGQQVGLLQTPTAPAEAKPVNRIIDEFGDEYLVDPVTGDVVEWLPAECPESGTVNSLVMCDSGVNFVRHFEFVNGVVSSFSDTNEAGEPYVVADPGAVTFGDCCSTIRRERNTLCDLNPEGPVGPGNEICVTKFVRETTFNCLGEIVNTQDFELDGVTPYVPVEPVECDFCPRTRRQQQWLPVDRVQDPDFMDDRHWIFTLQSPFDPNVFGTVKVSVMSTGSGSGGCSPAQASYSSNNLFTIVPDATVLGADILRVHLDDLDRGERVDSISPPPSYLDGNAMWYGSEVGGIANDRNGFLVYEGVPATATYRTRLVSCLGLDFSIWSSIVYSCCQEQDCCPTQEVAVLCDDNGPFLRTYQYQSGVNSGYRDTLLDGDTPYEVVGTVSVCGGVGNDPVSPQIVRNNGTSLDTPLFGDTFQEISVTWFDDGFIERLDQPGMLPVPAGFTWSIKGKPIIPAYTIRGTNYIVTRTPK